jgi:protein tyrosine/serine phosphatase
LRKEKITGKMAGLPLIQDVLRLEQEDSVPSPPFHVFEQVRNFRDSGLSRIYRAGHLDNASVNDVQKLQDMNVMSQIDLRTVEEIYVNKWSTFHAAIAKRLSFRDFIAPRIKMQGEPLTSRRPPQFQGERDIHNVNIFNVNYRRNAIWRRLTAKDILALGKYLIRFDKDGVEKYVGQKILAPRGILGLYKDMIDFSRDSFKAAYTVLEKELGAHQGNVVIHCTLGRDRTGIFVYLLRRLAGHSMEDIAADYHLSDLGFQNLKADLVAQYVKDGLTEEFATSPQEVIIALDDYIRLNYGSVEAYLSQPQPTK